MAPSCARERAKIPVASDGGWRRPDDCVHRQLHISQVRAPVRVPGKASDLPNTWGEHQDSCPTGRCILVGSPPWRRFTTASLWDGVFDMQVPCDKDRHHA